MARLLCVPPPSRKGDSFLSSHTGCEQTALTCLRQTNDLPPLIGADASRYPRDFDYQCAHRSAQLPMTVEGWQSMGGDLFICRAGGISRCFRAVTSGNVG